MIMCHDGTVISDGSIEELGEDIMCIIRSFVHTVPNEYLNEFMPRFCQDLRNPNSFLYMHSEDEQSNDEYWFDLLHCKPKTDSNMYADIYKWRNLKWDVYSEETV